MWSDCYLILPKLPTKVGIDIMTVLEAAKSKYNFQVHYAGPGVGGPCLPVNSYQMINLAKKKWVLIIWNLLKLQELSMKVCLAMW